MKNSPTVYHCLHCNRAETEIPLLLLRYAQKPNWICTHCLPTLIHQPHLLADKISVPENLPLLPPQT